MREPPEAVPSRGESARVYVPSRGRELWIASDDEEAAEELRRDGVELPVLLPSSPPRRRSLGTMANSDARAPFEALAKIQRVFRGSRLRKFLVAEECDA